MTEKGTALHQAVDRLRKEMHEAYAGTGQEVSRERLREVLIDALDRVMITYVQVELAKICNLPVRMPEDEDG